MSALAPIKAERALARHCPQLLCQGPDAAELLALLGQAGERMARLLPPLLATLCGGAPRAECAGVRQVPASDLGMMIAPVAVNGLFAVGPMCAPLLLSLPLEPVFRMVDRAFGGRGECPADLPEQLPTAADLMAARVERLMAEALASALAAADATPIALPPLRRGALLGELDAFAGAEQLALLVVMVTEASGSSWDLTIALPLTALGIVLGQSRLAPGPAKGARRPAMAAATSAPFADLPLPLSAVLVDMPVPFTTLTRLAVGQVLPVSVARNVPLRVGDQTIAHGSVGMADDRVAIQITRAFHA